MAKCKTLFCLNSVNANGEKGSTWLPKEDLHLRHLRVDVFTSMFSGNNHRYIVLLIDFVGVFFLTYFNEQWVMVIVPPKTLSDT